MTSLDFELDRGSGTGSSGVETPKSPSMTMASITSRYGVLRDRTSILDSDVGNDHRAAQVQTLDLLARDRSREDVIDLLSELNRGRGLGWSEIARLVGVTVQTVRKWRNRAPVTGEHRLAVARLAALLDLLETVPVFDPAGWLEIPLINGYSMTHADLYKEGRPDLLFDLAHLRISPEDALAELSPNWHVELRQVHETFVAEDGQLSIRRRL